MKVFIDNNFDEESSVLPDTNAKFNNIDINLNIDSGKARMDIYKMMDNFIDETDVERIIRELPGYDNNLNIEAEPPLRK